MRVLLASAISGAALLLAALLAATSAQAQQQTLSFTCDLGGMPAQMTMQMEFVSSSGITVGPGANPAITGVIPTGDYTIYTAGVVQSQTAQYSFRGENQFADFVGDTGERFLVQWIQDPARGGIWMIVNPFDSPERRGQHFCQMNGQD